MKTLNLNEFEAILKTEDQLKIKTLSGKIIGGNSPLESQGVKQ